MISAALLRPRFPFQLRVGTFLAFEFTLKEYTL